ncbi:DUF4440 domain-containing protein, partial [bacterium]|nr:DUF4440 domain-containing protein [bacterium]
MTAQPQRGLRFRSPRCHTIIPRLSNHAERTTGGTAMSGKRYSACAAMPWLSALACCGLLGGCRAHCRPQGELLDQLIETERAFCRAAARASVRAAFLEYLSDDAVMFLPRPANGKQAYAARPETASDLRWRPSCAGISAAGDLGYTFGPWEFRRSRGQDDADAHGHFLSVWRRQPDGRWLLAFDSGVSHQRPDTVTEEIELRPARKRGAQHALDGRELRAAADGLLALDRSLGDTAATADAAGRLLPVLDERVTLFEEARLPVTGRAAAGEALRAGPAAIEWRPLHAAVAASGDLGY